MKNSILTLVLVCLSLFVFAQKPTVESLKDAELGRFKVMIAKDRAGLEAVLHKDLVYHHSGGNTDNKE